MKKILSLTVGLVCIVSLLFPVKIADLPEITKYPRLFVDKDHFYIIDDNTLKIHIYSKKDVKHMKDFSKGGEGPGEFKFAPELVVYPDYLFLMERGKVCRFSKAGILTNWGRCVQTIKSFWWRREISLAPNHLPLLI